MNKTQFQSWLRRATTFRELTTEHEFEMSEYWAAYMRGLRRHYYGDQFGTADEHEIWYNIPANTSDLTRRARGEGYRAGFAGTDPIQLFTAASIVKNIRKLRGWSTTKLGEELGVSPRTVESWEQGLRTPSGPALKLMKGFINE